jgi:YgiT-type zinc finger domain-containing protein
MGNEENIVYKIPQESLQTIKNLPAIKCPYCNREIHQKRNYNQWHGDKCKNKINIK